MKRAILILLVAACAWSLRAQEALTGADFPGAITKTIVRAYTGASSLGYVEAGGHHYFTLDDGSSSIVGVEIDSLLTVHDFVVHGDYVYFCGENQNSQAVVGWFKTQTFFAGQSNYYQFDYFLLPGLSFTKSLYSICVYNYANSTRIVAVGVGSNGGANIVYLEGLEGLATSWQNTVGESSEQSEFMLRVCSTDNYVVTAGTIFNDHDGISLRVFGKRDLFAAGGPQNRYHRYSSEDSNPLIDFPLTDSSSTELGLTHMNGDSVAVMAEWVYRNTQNTHFGDGLLFHVYDIGNTVGQVNPLADYSVLIHQTTWHPSDWEIVGLGYSQPLSRLHFAVRSTLGLDRIGELALPPAVIDCRRVANVDFGSMDGEQASPVCLCLGANALSSNRLQTYRFLLGTNTSDCATTFSVIPDSAHLFREKNHYCPLLTNHYVVDFFEVVPIRRLGTSIEYDCQP